MSEITRYAIIGQAVRPSPNGVWVHYKDYLAATAELRRELEELKRTQVVCPNCQTSKHLLQASAGWWCNGCGGGITQKELEIQSLEQRLKDQWIVQESNRILLEKQAAENDELKRQLWGAERRVVNLERERDALKREVEELREDKVRLDTLEGMDNPRSNNPMTDRQLAEKMAEALNQIEGRVEQAGDYLHNTRQWDDPDSAITGDGTLNDWIFKDVREALAAYMEAHPTPTTPCTPSSQDPN